MRSLLFVACAACAPVAARSLPAQQPPVPPVPPAARPAPPPLDSAAADSASRAVADARAARLRADTIKAPIARAQVPRGTEIGGDRWHWDRDAIFESGALTLGELLAVVPGVTTLGTGFIVSPQAGVYLGDPAGLRVFADGVEVDAVNARNGGITDLTVFPLFAVEDVMVERGAGELRVHLRSWRVDRTSANTRTDVLTGSENLNLYRGYFGRRLPNGGVIQAAGQQFSTISRGGNDGDALGAMARLGLAAGSWSVDGTLLRRGVTRSAGARFLATAPQLNVLPGFSGSESVAYARVTWRDPSTDGPWLQLIAATIGASESHATSTSGLLATATTDTVDTLRSRAQYVLAAGLTRWSTRLSTTTRVRSIGGKISIAPGVRAEFDSRLLTVSVFGERGVDSTNRADVLARFAPRSWLQFSGGASRTEAGPHGEATIDARAEAGLRVRDAWLSGGLITRGARKLAPPIELDTALRAVSADAATGVLVSLRTPLLLGWAFDADAVNWDAVSAYRPQTQARARLWFSSSFLNTFPRGTFHVLASGTVDYRDATFTPLGTDPLRQASAASTVFSTLLEIRIGTAVISWQNRNFLNTIYESYPGYVMPRLTNLYGIRWQFWN